MTFSEERQKILIVDDNKQNIEMLMELFRDDFKIAAAINAERALKIASSDAPPDIILLDILMPDMDGYQLCTKLKEQEKTKNIPVIFVTAVSEVMDATRGFALGAVDYITKPFHPPMVRARVELHLNLMRKQQLLEEYAFLDGLTELPNRRYLDDNLSKEWFRHLRSGRELSMILFDVDFFRAYNEAYGHGHGDNCLKQLARSARGALRSSGDFVARYGGESFAVLLPETGAEEAQAMARRILEDVDKLAIPHEGSSQGGRVTVSLGVGTVRPDESLDAPVLVRAATQALTEAKEAGRHCVRSVEL